MSDTGKVYARKQLANPHAKCSRCDFYVDDESPRATRRKVRRHVARTAHTVWIDLNISYRYEYVLPQDRKEAR